MPPPEAHVLLRELQPIQATHLILLRAVLSMH